jgi:spermidine/putrescine transport system substrate-binding protein
MLDLTPFRKTNAEKFINFMMAPENGATLSNFNRYTSPLDATAIAAYIDPALGKAQEINLDPSIPIHFSQTCDSKAIKMYDKVWTKVLQ